MTYYQPQQGGQYGQGGWSGYQQPGGYPPPPRRSRKPLITILLAIVAVIVIAVVVVVLITSRGGGGGGGGAGSASSATHSQDAAKQNLIAQKPGQGPAITYGPATIFDACALLPMSTLSDNGITLDPTKQLQHEYFNRNVPNDAAVRVPFPQTASTCVYPLPNPTDKIGAGGIDVNVYQAPAARGVTDAHDLSTSTQHSASGLTVYVGQVNPISAGDKPTKLARIVGPSAVAEINIGQVGDTIEGKAVSDLLPKLADSVAAQLVKGPAAPSVFGYGAPHQSAKQPCDALSSDSFQKYTGTVDSGSGDEKFDVSEQKISIEGSDAFLVTSQCIRQSTPQGGSVTGDKYILIELDNYRDVDSAKQAVDNSECNPNSQIAGRFGPPVKADDKIGDGAACVNIEDNATYHFRVGNTAVQLSDESKSSPKNDPTQYAKAVAPLAKMIAANLAS